MDDPREWNAARRQACSKLNKALGILRHRIREIDAINMPANTRPWWAGECFDLLGYVTDAYDLIAGLQHPAELLDEMADL